MSPSDLIKFGTGAIKSALTVANQIAVKIPAAVIALIQRVLIELNGTNAYYSLDSQWTPTGDFEIEFDIAGDPQSDNKILSINGGIYTYSIGTVSTGALNTMRISTTGGTNFDLTVPILNGKLNHVKMHYDVASNDSSFFVNGVQDDGIRDAGLIDLSNGIGIQVGRQFNLLDYFTGTVANLQLNDLVTPANSFFFPMGEATANSESNNGNTLNYNNIGTAVATRDNYTLNRSGTEWEGSLKVIEIAAQS
mgnify:CR=1 FL=1